LVTSSIGTAFRNTLYGDRYRGLEDEEEEVSRWWITLRKREDTGHLKKKHQITLCGELSLEEAVGL
jgi:hypothetical protein